MKTYILRLLAIMFVFHVALAFAQFQQRSTASEKGALEGEQRAVIDRKKELEDQYMKVYAQNETLNADIRALGADCERLKSWIEQLNSRKEQLNSRKEQLDGRKEQLENWKEQLDSRKVQLDSWKEQLREREGTRMPRAELEQMYARVAQYNAEAAKYGHEVAQFSAEAAPYNAEAAKREAEVANYRSEVAKYDADNTEAQRKKDEIETRRTSINEKFKEIADEKERLNVKERELTEKINALVKEETEVKSNSNSFSSAESAPSVQTPRSNTSRQADGESVRGKQTATSSSSGKSSNVPRVNGVTDLVPEPKAKIGKLDINQSNHTDQAAWDAQFSNGSGNAIGKAIGGNYFSGADKSGGPVQKAEANYNTTLQTTAKGMEQIIGNTAKLQDMVNTMMSRLNNGGTLTDGEAGQLAGAIDKLQEAGVPLPTLSVVPNGEGGYIGSKDGNGDSAPLSANDLIENQQIKMDALREAQDNQRQLDLSLDNAQGLHNTAKDVAIHNSYSGPGDWTDHPDINGAPLTEPQIQDARQRVLNGQPLDPDIEDRLNTIDMVVTQTTIQPKDSNHLWDGDSRYSPEVLRIVNDIIAIRNSSQQNGAGQQP